MRVTNSGGSWNSADVSEAVIYAADNGAHVISMSLQSFAGAMTILENALAYAYDSGTLPVAAAGNVPSSGAGHVAWPARYDKCMAIAGSTSGDAHWFDSFNFGSCDGPEVDVAAPARSVFNIWRSSGYQMQTGTSMATPHVAGLAGLLMSHNPALSVPQVESIIRTTAEDVNAGMHPGFDNFLGHGRINAHAALQAANPSCEGDATGNGTVDVDDLIAVILAWGQSGGPADVNNSGTVDVDDLITVILNWGAC
jgi:thermitase